MDADDSSSFVTLEADLLTEEGSYEPLQAKLAACPFYAPSLDDLLQPRSIGSYIDYYLHIGERNWLVITRSSDPRDGLLDYCNRASTAIHKYAKSNPRIPDPSPDTLLESLLALPVPVFGSLPKAWTTLSTALGSCGITASAAVLEMGHHPPVTYFAILGAMAVFVNVGVPVTRAVGRGLGYRLERFLGVPVELTTAATSKGNGDKATQEPGVKSAE